MPKGVYTRVKLFKKESLTEEQQYKRSRMRFDALRSLLDPYYNDYTLLDEEADEWLTRLNRPIKYERQNIKIRDGEKPKGAFKNNGRKKK
jgi:hypothetical protein|tara:strand:- start:2733 stop:3002 length:270 start_codon:yes stop_codon:yes gene_type:complete